MSFHLWSVFAFPSAHPSSQREKYIFVALNSYCKMHTWTSNTYEHSFDLYRVYSHAVCRFPLPSYRDSAVFTFHLVENPNIQAMLYQLPHCLCMFSFSNTSEFTQFQTNRSILVSNIKMWVEVCIILPVKAENKVNICLCPYPSQIQPPNC